MTQFTFDAFFILLCKSPLGVGQGDAHIIKCVNTQTKQSVSAIIDMGRTGGSEWKSNNAIVGNDLFL